MSHCNTLVYKYDTIIAHHGECVRVTCRCRTISWWSNVCSQWMNEGIPWNWFSPWTSMWVSKYRLRNSTLTEWGYYHSTFIFGFPSRTSMWIVKCEKYLISPPQQKYSPLSGHPLRHLSVLRMYSFCQSPDLPFVKMYSRPYMAYMARTWHAWGPPCKWPVNCCLKPLLELFKWD